MYLSLIQILLELISIYFLTKDLIKKDPTLGTLDHDYNASFDRIRKNTLTGVSFMVAGFVVQALQVIFK